MKSREGTHCGSSEPSPAGPHTVDRQVYWMRETHMHVFHFRGLLYHLRILRRTAGLPPSLPKCSNKYGVGLVICYSRVLLVLTTGENKIMPRSSAYVSALRRLSCASTDSREPTCVCACAPPVIVTHYIATYDFKLLSEVFGL
jgi:hypothetical protein